MLREVFNPTVAGLGKAGIQELVAAFSGDDPRDDSCDPYEPKEIIEGAVVIPDEEEEDEQYEDGGEEEEIDEENQAYDYPEYGSEEVRAYIGVVRIEI